MLPRIQRRSDQLLAANDKKTYDRQIMGWFSSKSRILDKPIPGPPCIYR